MRRMIGYSLFGCVIALGATPERAFAEELTCSDVAQRLIDDFEDGNTTTPDGSGGWYLDNDGTGAQLPANLAQLVSAEGLSDSEFAARTSGEGFTDWGAVVGVGFGCARSVDGFNGVRFAIQAPTASVFNFKVPTVATQSEDTGGECSGEACNDHFAIPLALADGRLSECSVRFEDLAQQCFGTPAELDLNAVTGVELFFPANADFDVTLDNLRFDDDVAQSGCVAIEPQLQCEAP